MLDMCKSVTSDEKKSSLVFRVQIKIFRLSMAAKGNFR